VVGSVMLDLQLGTPFLAFYKAAHFSLLLDASWNICK